MTGAIRLTLIAFVMSLATMHIDNIANIPLVVYCLLCLLRAVLWYSAGIAWGHWFGERKSK